jgi:hypothetical protein
MPLPEFDETTEIHTLCPFCKGEYVKRAGKVSHSWPECGEFSRATSPDEFLMIARIAEAQKPQAVSR